MVNISSGIGFYLYCYGGLRGALFIPKQSFLEDLLGFLNPLVGARTLNFNLSTHFYANVLFLIRKEAKIFFFST